jgi:hypothetical protein
MHPGVRLSTEVAPAIVAVGDSLTLRVIMENTTSSGIEPGPPGCGPPVAFELRSSSGDVVYPIPLTGVYTCARYDYHDLDPFEIDTLVMRRRLDLQPGAWSVRGGFRDGRTIRQLTAPVHFTVQ